MTSASLAAAHYSRPLARLMPATLLVSVLAAAQASALASVLAVADSGRCHAKVLPAACLRWCLP
eukprot:4313670-Alexandrium_andersonii.AAC.1